MSQLCLFVVLHLYVAVSGGNTVSTSTSPSAADIFPKGDVRNCKLPPGQLLFEVLPGSGWDNLRMLEMGSTVALNYLTCLTTRDQTYIIPDYTRTVPVKHSNIELFSEIISHWYNYSETTSRSMSAGGSVGFGTFGSISGSYSTNYQSAKSHQINERAETVRVQLRHHLYTIMLEPDAPLHPVFKSRIMDIAAHLLRNRTEQAQYLCQLLVRDYGTHYITRVDAGAILAQEDQVSKSYMAQQSSRNSSRQVKTAASASFFVKISADFQDTSTETKQWKDAYEKQRTYSHIISHGGATFGSNFKLNEWERNLTNGLVAIDRAGNPLHYGITPATMPELPASTVIHVAREVENAIKQYYKYNTHFGCTFPDSPNFNFLSNLEDGSCTAKITNLTFGGVYQTCKMAPGSTDDFCGIMSQTNPLTAKFSCPDHYQAVLLHNGHQTRSYTHQSCHQACDRCGWIFKHSCHCRQECVNFNKISTAEYSAYWCAAKDTIPPQSGYLFGGLYTSINGNPITGSHSCPNKFESLTLGANMKVCVSSDFEWGYKDSVPFAGFFSCVSGNPLVDSKMAEPPKRCPHGFSQHLAALENDCEINYCIKTNAFTPHGFSPIHQPPFSEYPISSSNVTEVFLIINDNGRAWYKNPKTNIWAETRTVEASMMTPAKAILPVKDETAASVVAAGSEDDGQLSTGQAAGLGVGGTLLLGLVILVLVISYKKVKNRSNLYREESLPFSQSNTNNA